MQALSLLSCAGLGVGKAVDAAIGMENHGAGHHRAGQAAAAYLVNTCDRHEPVAVQAVFNIASCGNLSHSRHRTHCTHSCAR